MSLCEREITIISEASIRGSENTMAHLGKQLLDHNTTLFISGYLGHCIDIIVKRSCVIPI